MVARDDAMTDRALHVSTPLPEPDVRRPLDLQLIAIGVAGGILSGLLGVGGGVVMVPLLVLWAGYRQREAHAMSLGAIVPLKC